MTSPDTTTTTATTAAVLAGNPARKKALTAVAATVVVAGIAYGIYWATVLAQRRQSADLKARALEVQIALIRALGGGYTNPGATS